MMRNIYCTCGLLAAVLFASCVPQRIVWSPDGERAAVIGDDGLHLCDVKGKLSPALVKDAKCVEWMPDSSRLLVCVHQEFKTWADVSKAFPDDAKVAEKNYEAVLQELSSTGSSWSKFWQGTKQKLQLTNEQLAMTLLAIRDRSPGSSTANLTHEQQQIFREQSIRQETVQLYRLKDDTVKAETMLYQRVTSGDGVQSMRVSPTGKAVLVTYSNMSRDGDQQSILELWLVPTDGSTKSIDLGKSAKYPDWSPDGKSVVYITPVDWDGQKQTLIGDLLQRQVVGDDGNFLNSSNLPGEDYAGLLFNELSRVRVAKDGRIFFSTTEVSLPVASRDFDGRPTIFSFEPGKQSTLTRVVPRGSIHDVGDAAHYFELSPDAKYISIPFNDGRVSLLKVGSLASDDVQIVQVESKREGDNESHLASVPVWRTATELTFVRPTADGKAHEVVRYSATDKSATVISGDWPASVGGWIAPQPEPEKVDGAATKK